MRIPFDSLCLAAVVAELRPFVGGRLQRIVQPGPLDVALQFYSGAHGEAALLLSAETLWCRAHLITKRPSNTSEPGVFLSALRARIGGATLVGIEQPNFDRILSLDFESHRLIAELMGKHANLILVEAGGRIVQSVKVVGPSKSRRPVAAGRVYEPPFPVAPSLLEADDGVGLSPFLETWLEAGGTLQEVRSGRFAPVWAQGHGAYPLSVARLGLTEVRRDSYSLALENHLAEAIPAHEAEQLKRSLISGLERVHLAREVALSDLRQALETAGRAPRNQRFGELILAYGYASPGGSLLEAFDYDGTPVSIRVDPALTPPENADLYFHKAKKALARQGYVREQLERLTSEAAEVIALLEEVRLATRLDALRALRDRANQRKWLHSQTTSHKTEVSPFEGHKIREVLGPGGFTVLYGETATANDYLTLRVAKPDDWWLHVLGATGAHVVIRTHKQPHKVTPAVFEFAASLAKQNSAAKHSGYVEVVVTQKRYVRKPRGSAPGTVVYTHERTLRIGG